MENAFEYGKKNEAHERTVCEMLLNIHRKGKRNSLLLKIQHTASESHNFLGRWHRSQKNLRQ